MPFACPTKQREYFREYRQKHRERQREYTRKWKRQNPDKSQASKRRAQAKFRGHAPPDPSGPTLPQLVLAQYGRCAVCAEEAPLVLDHCHITGHIRGALCRGCNLGIGHLKDRPELLNSAKIYLEATCHSAV